MGYSNQEVCHLWASGNKDSASSNHGNVYFQGRKLYSYGSHFMLGYRMGPGTVFLNSDGYSISTSKHKGYASSATSHYSNRFYVPGLQNFADFLDIIAGHRREARKGASLKELRQRVERKAADYLANAESPAREMWEWIFAEVGLAPSRLDVIGRKVSRAKVAKAAADEKEAVATWRTNGKRFAEMSGSEFASEIGAHRHAENGYAGLSGLENLANRLHLAHKQANRDGFTRRKVILWQRLRRVRDAIKAMKESGVASYVNPSRLSRAVRAVAIVRELERGLAAGATPGPRAYEQTARHVVTLLDGGHMPPATREALRGYLARLHAARDARTLEIERERYEAEQEERRAWLAGESGFSRARLSDERGGALIRATDAELDGCAVIGGELETSHGARVPLRHAARVFAFVRRVRESGEEWQADPARPVRVGHYQLDRVEASGDFVAGCHRINWGETERLARELGLWDCTPADLATDEPADVA